MRRREADDIARRGLSLSKPVLPRDGYEPVSTMAPGEPSRLARGRVPWSFAFLLVRNHAEEEGASGLALVPNGSVARFLISCSSNLVNTDFCKTWFPLISEQPVFSSPDNPEHMLEEVCRRACDCTRELRHFLPVRILAPAFLPPHGRHDPWN